MPTRDEFIETLAETLGEFRLHTERVGDTLNVSQGKSRLATKANLDLNPILTRLEAAPDADTDRLMGGFASGVKAVLAEPKNSKADSWSFELTAGRMVANLEADTFLEGVEAAGQKPAWYTRFSDELILVTMIELDRGFRVLTAEQVQGWGVTDDRVYSAARSMLFHKTRNTSLRQNDPRPSVHHIKVGDGYDAARAIVATDAFFTELDEASFRFSAPHQDILLYVQGTDDETLQALKEATQQAYNDAEYPLSTQIYQLQIGRPATAASVA